MNKDNKIKDIYKMGLFSNFEPRICGSSYDHIIRVPGGWVYKAGNGMVFIPFNNEFDGFWDNGEKKS